MKTDDAATHAALCQWGVWADYDTRGPKRHTDAHPWAKEIPASLEWENDHVDPRDEAFMEEIQLAFIALSNRNWPAACIIAKHYRDWRLGEREHPQPFPNAVLRQARAEFEKHWRATGLDLAAGLD